MKTTENKQYIALVENLSQVRKAIRDLGKEEENLKKQVKNIMKERGVNILVIGDYVAVISNDKSTIFSKEKALEIMGEEKYKSCITYGTIEKLKVSKQEENE